MEKLSKTAFAIAGLLWASFSFGQSPVDKVNVMIGTTGASDTEYGGLTPAVAPPFAMTQWCAQTRESRIAKALSRRFIFWPLQILADMSFFFYFPKGNR
jgi:hypothetical protein